MNIIRGQDITVSAAKNILVPLLAGSCGLPPGPAINPLLAQTWRDSGCWLGETGTARREREKY